MKTIGIIGMGNMGSHLFRLLKKNRLDLFLSVSDTNLSRTKNITEVPVITTRENIEDSDILFVTVKPNNVREICKEINKISLRTNLGDNKKTIISTAAGVSISKIQEWTEDVYIYRMMPSIPISEKKGSIVWYTEETDECHNHLIREITTGPPSLWVQDEKLIDVATVVFGCSPAYIAEYFRTWRKVCDRYNISREKSRELLVSNFNGTMDLILSEEMDKEDTNEGDMDEEDIINKVGSEGGVTEKMLETIRNRDVDKIIQTSVLNSLDRIRTIANNLS